MQNSEQYLQWLEFAALPFWTQKAWDNKHGGWFERLTPSGKPDINASRRTRVQSRQITVLCQASYLGWNKSDNLNKALDTLDWWWQHSWCKDGLPGLCHQLDAQGQINNDKRDAYDHAFAILGLSWAYRQTGDKQIQAMLDQVFDFMDEHMLHPAGGLVEYCMPVSQGAGRFQLTPWRDSRRQNPHMHLFEAAIAAYQALKQHQQSTNRVSRTALACLSLFHEHFHDVKNGQIIEHFDQNWHPNHEKPLRYVEPGHGAEWVWLLHDAQINAAGLGIKVDRVLLENLNAVALTQGFDEKTGVVINWFDPVTHTRSTSARSWPMMEVIRAGLALGLEEQVERGVETLMHHFNISEQGQAQASISTSLFGGWRDSVRLDGTHTDKEAPAGGAQSMQTSTLYHVMGVAMAFYYYQIQ